MLTFYEDVQAERRLRICNDVTLLICSNVQRTLVGPAATSNPHLHVPFPQLCFQLVVERLHWILRIHRRFQWSILAGIILWSTGDCTISSIHSLTKTLKELSIHHPVDVTTEVVEEHPVTDLALVNDHIKVTLVWEEPSTELEQTEPHARRDHCEDSVDEGEYGEHSQDDEPEPQEGVDLLIDDIQSKHTQGIMLLNGTRWTIAVECALGDFGENFVHRIGSVFDLCFGYILEHL